MKGAKPILNYLLIPIMIFQLLLSFKFHSFAKLTVFCYSIVISLLWFWGELVDKAKIWAAKQAMKQIMKKIEVE